MLRLVPDLLGLFYSIAVEASGRLGLRLNPVRLTEHPMPVDGLIVDQTASWRHRYGTHPLTRLH
jgi:hypothetical protein